MLGRVSNGDAVSFEVEEEAPARPSDDGAGNIGPVDLPVLPRQEGGQGKDGGGGGLVQDHHVGEEEQDKEGLQVRIVYIGETGKVFLPPPSSRCFYSGTEEGYSVPELFSNFVDSDRLRKRIFFIRELDLLYCPVYKVSTTSWLNNFILIHGNTSLVPFFG